MMHIQITDHAKVRMRQRGIDDGILPLLVQYGKKTHDNRGGTVLYLTKESRHRIEREHGKDLLKRFDGKLDIYAVVNQGNGVITVGHRYKRIQRH